MDSLEKYIQEIPFQEIELEQLTSKDIEGMNTKEGIIIPSKKTTSLWIHRKLSIHNVLNSPVIMESATDYEIRDSFGYAIWEGDSESAISYVKGFYEND